jgi:hypothetical protein
MFRYAPADGSPVVGTENIPELVEDDDTPLVVKLFGSVAPSSVDDSFVITEDDYVDQALALGRRDFLPKYVEYMLSRASFLFLGYGLRDWNLRVLLRSLENRLDASTRPRSWAIMAQPSRIDIELWRRRDVDIIDVWLDEYAARLEQRLAQTDLGTLPS